VFCGGPFLGDLAESGRGSARIMPRAVITVGCFDLFHRGHVALFSHMREHGDRVCVGVHDSQSMFRNKQVIGPL
jgi:cytidyltransferase-like protein